MWFNVFKSKIVKLIFSEVLIRPHGLAQFSQKLCTWQEPQTEFHCVFEKMESITGNNINFVKIF